MKYSVLVPTIVSMFVFTVGVLAQPRGMRDQTIFVDYGDRFYAETYVLPTKGADSAQLTVFFRMASDFLTFVKVTDRADVGGNYKADMPVNIEVRDSLGVIRNRQLWRGTAYTNSFEETNNKNEFHYGWAQMTVGPGTYTVSLEISAQKESNQKKLRLPPVTFSPGRRGGQLSPVMFADPQEGPYGDLVSPFVFTGNLPFVARDAVALLFVADETPQTYDYSIKQLPPDARDIRWWQVSDVVESVTSQPGVVPVISMRSTSDKPLLEFRKMDAMTNPIATMRIPVPVTALVPGRYELRLVRRGASDTITTKFQILWEMMPLGLRNLNYAVDIMRYILTDEEMDRIDDGPDSERRAKLMDYWRKQDPTGATTYNERMAEYFKRVDQAFFAFSTIQEPDGAKSERGKIYILHGPPTNVSRKPTSGDRPVEIWTYSNAVNKTFTFEIDDKGIYRLRKIAATTGDH